MRQVLASVIFAILWAGCVTPVKTPPTPESGCPAPPPDVFRKVGVDFTLAQTTLGKLVLGAIDVKTHPEVVSLVSEAVSDDRAKAYLECMLTKAGFTVDQVIYLHEMDKFLSTKPTASEFIEFERLHASRRSGSSRREEVPPGWEVVDIKQTTVGQTSFVRAPWTDISWVGSYGWLCGVPDEGGGGGNVGTGILLRTTDAGNTWSEVPKGNFDSGTGDFRWSPCGADESEQNCARHYRYHWDEVGPIKSLLFWRPTREERIKGVLATATGIYVSADNGEHWQRSTPTPSDRNGYALFSRVADVEGFNELYAVGWQGIAHWPDRHGQWELQLPTYSYALFSVLVGTDREIWAVGMCWFGVNVTARVERYTVAREGTVGLTHCCSSRKDLGLSGTPGGRPTLSV